MQTDTHSISFLIDGHEISAKFAESRNADAIRQVREILLSAFAAGVSPKCGDSLAKSHGPRDNGDGESHVP